jgi:fibronectin-binding autotransporter adhesin
MNTSRPLKSPSKTALMRNGLILTLLAGMAAPLQAQTRTWRDSSTNLAGATSWIQGGSNVGPPTATETGVFDNVTVASTLTTGNNLSWGAIDWNAPQSATFQLSAGATANRELTLNGISGALIDISSGSLTISATPNAGGFRLGLTLANSGSMNVASGASLSISSPITGSANITKTGLGTMLIYGGHPGYTGTTSVAAGLLGGTGSIAAVVVQNGGTINPGGISTIGTFQSGNLGLDSGSTFALKLDTSNVESSSMIVNGALTLTSGALLSLTDLGANVSMSLGTTFTLIDYTTWNGGLFTYNSAVLADDAVFAFGANTYQISYNGVDNLTSAVTLTTVVPEPSTAVLLIGALGVCVLGKRGRRQSLQTPAAIGFPA